MLVLAFFSYFELINSAYSTETTLLGGGGSVRKYFNINGRQPQSTDIDVVSLTVGGDFFILFNNSALTSWILHIRNIRSITFVGPPTEYVAFHQNMETYYPHLISQGPDDDRIPIRWVNETHWIEKYMSGYGKAMPCPYWKVCQQLIKLHIFDLRTSLDFDMLDNILIIDSDTVWARGVTFINETNGNPIYLEVDEGGPDCNGMDAIQFTEAMTMGPPANISDENSVPKNTSRTLSPYTSCNRPEFATSTGYRHIGHHMLFQYDVMMSLHDAVVKSWNTTWLWQASNKCFKYKFCQGRVSEYELYFNYVREHYPQRLQLETVKQGRDIMLGSAICDEQEMECCREQSVVLKGCHDHRVSYWRENPEAVGDMCSCEKTRAEH